MIKYNAGFTLLEIMVVVVIISILASLVAPKILGRIDDARITKVKSDLDSIEAALDLYYLDNSIYPSTEQGLDALVKKPDGLPEAKNYHEDGYLKSLPIDPWDVPYLYLSPGDDNRPYDIYTLGADGKEAGEGKNADIGHWSST